MFIDVYSHCIKVSKVLYDRDLNAMLSFCRPLVEMGFEKRGRKFIPVPARTFASATRDRREFRFHRNQLQELLHHLKIHKGYRDNELTITHHVAKLEDYPRFDYEVAFMYPPRENQPDIINYVLDNGEQFPERDAIIKMVTLQTGKGKCLRNDTPVRTPGGWLKMDLIRVGDDVVSRDGSTTRVTGVYPQGALQLYTVTFADGRKVEACGEHLWQSFYVNTSEHKRWQVRNTLEMKRLISMPNPRVYIPLIEPEELPEQNLYIDPYLLGALIGDGCLTQDSLTFTTPDDFMVKQLNWLLPVNHKLIHSERYNYRINTGRDSQLRNELRDLGLLGKYAVGKFIPWPYLNGSIEQRLHLMQGLMDTDGTVQKTGSLTYSTVSEQLAKDVQYLVRSLGGIATIRPRQTYYTWNGEKKPGQLCYEVDIRHTKPSDFLRLPRKRDRVNDDNQYSKDLKLRVISIEPSEVAEATCISVDHPEKLFVVQDFIVTHNTYIAQYCMKELRSRTVIHFKGGYTERWKSDLIKTFKLKKGQLLIVRGTKDMANLQHMALDGTLEALIIIISSATMREYIKHFEEGNGKSATFPIHPGEFYPKLGISFRVTDELHQEFHTNFKIDLYTHVPKSLGLSATMVSSDPFKNKMYEIGYPSRWRHDGGGYDAFIGVTALTYTTQSEVNLKYMGGQGYSHTAYEESIMKYPDVLSNYLRIIERTVFREFISQFEAGQKMLIFCARVEFCTMLVEYLLQRHPSFDIVRYVGSENDSYDALLESDIGVTTVGSGGTAIDIVNLVGSLMTTAIDSRQSNEQVLGRTRRVKDWPDMTPWFIYMVNTGIDQHVKYHHNKKDFFAGKVVYHNEIRSSTNL